MAKLVFMIILIMLVDFSIGTPVSYNQPKFSPCASWNPTAYSYNTTTQIGQKPDGIFVDTNNIVYVATRANRTLQGWEAASLQRVRTIPNNSDEPIGLFVSTNEDIYVGTGNSSNRVDKWALNATSADIVMNVSNSCYGLFIDMNNTLYCSMQDAHKVVRKPLYNNGTSQFIAAGNGSCGSGSFMLNGPRGIFLDNESNLYVADRYNNRIQLFRFGQLNGTTLIGNGTIETAGNISLNQPTSVVLDADNYLFIVDSNNHRIIGSGPYGYRCLVGCSTSSGTQLNDPRTLSFTSYGTIFVTDGSSNQVHAFSISANYCNDTLSTQNVDVAAVMTTLVMAETTSITSTHSTQMETTMILETTTGNHSTNRSVINPPPLPNFVPTACNDSYRIGITCNISNAPCDMLKPCQNQGTCINNKSISSGYICSCLSGFNGSECQLDIRPCKTNTCWNNGTCLNISSSEFLCKCAEGWEGIHCETMVNYCGNITCENNGVCRPLFRDYQCECSSSDYSGRYCEITASTLIARKAVSKSFGYIAIICILIVIGFIVILDALKYIFRIDPTRDELERLQRQKLSKKKKTPAIPMRFKYVHQSSSQVPPTSSDTSISIIEESSV